MYLSTIFLLVSKLQYWYWNLKFISGRINRCFNFPAFWEEKLLLCFVFIFLFYLFKLVISNRDITVTTRKIVITNDNNLF